MARVLAISSQVARGAIGLSASVPVLQALGHEVIALPTVLLSNHPGHARFAGERIGPDLLRRMLDALDDNGWLGEVDAVLTGYLPSPEHVDIACEAVTRVRRRRPDALAHCDPVLGDEPKGLYIAETAAGAIRDRLVPLADVVKLNRFELGWLTGAAPVDIASVSDAARRFEAGTVIVTSVTVESVPRLYNVAVSAAETWVASVVLRGRVPHGTGDAFGGLLLGYMLAGEDRPLAMARATAAVDLMLDASLGQDEMTLARTLPHLLSVAGVAVEQLR
jgi:pyridoxine kinase